jgi:hypothetical protein
VEEGGRRTWEVLLHPKTVGRMAGDSWDAPVLESNGSEMPTM